MLYIHVFLYQFYHLSMPSLISKVYYNPSSPGGFGGVERLFREVKDGKTRKDVMKFLKSADAYTLHKPVRKRYERVNVTAMAPMEILQMDLCDLQRYANYNNDIKYLLVIIDVYSRYVWVETLKGKKCEYVARKFESFILETGHLPAYISTDEGGEFTGLCFERLMKKYGIGRYKLHSEHKAMIAERFIRTIKEKIFRYLTYIRGYTYIDVLPQLVEAYNKSIHRSLKGRTPKEAFSSGEEYNPRIKRTISKLKIGTYVRVSRIGNVFKKGYTDGWSHEIFKISGVSPKTGLYSIKDLNDESIQGGFYEKELQSVDFNHDRYYDIEKVLKSEGKGRNRRYLVRWKGYPSTFDTYISHTQLRKSHH